MTVSRDDLFLADIIAYARRIQSHVAGGRDEFLTDPKTQDAVIRCFEVIGEATKRVSPALRAQHPEIPWKRIGGFRDILIHGYDRVDLPFTWGVIEDELPTLISALEQISKSRGRP